MIYRAQESAKKLAKTGIKSGYPLLIVGRSGSGKSTLAKILAGKNLTVELSHPEVPRHILTGPLGMIYNHPNRFVIADEIHVSDELLAWPLFLDKFSGTTLFTTTHPHLLPEALITRCVRVELESYTTEDLMQIIADHVDLSRRERYILARVSRGIPREGIKNARLYSATELPIEKFLTEVLRMKKFGDDIFYPEEYKYLTYLKSVGRASKSTIQAATRIVDIDRVEENLLATRSIKVSSRGRELIIGETYTI